VIPLVPCPFDDSVICAYHSVIGGPACVQGKCEISVGYCDGISGPRFTVLIDAEEHYSAIPVVAAVDLHDCAERLGTWKRSEPVAGEILALYCARIQKT
jgi:hypothetical protein